MSLELQPPYPPMEALSVDEIPAGDEWQYEPKWDGFRCIAFRDGDHLELQSKAGQPLARYFPEVVEMLRRLSVSRFVLDGELAIPEDAGLSFDKLLQRLHPAASRVRKLSAETPAIYIVFDLLADKDGQSLTDLPLMERRARLEKFAHHWRGEPSIKLSPATMSIAEARRWFERAGPALDGIIAKRRDLSYQSGERTGMQKIKTYRSADCVVGGFRYGTGKKVVGSLLLGLFGEDGLLHHVGFTSALKTAERPELTRKLQAIKQPPGFTGRAPGGTSRWATEKSGEWTPLAPRFVVEISYDHFTGGRFRHGTRLLRWRPDKAAEQCTMDQVAQKQGNLAALFCA